MKNFIVTIGILFLFNSDQVDGNQNSLSYINNVNKLEFTFMDNSCGEWGGNEKNITIYRDGFKGQLLADYTENLKDCKTGQNSKTPKSQKRIKLTQKDNQLIVEAMNELIKNKLNREEKFSHSGLFCQVMLSDSTILIKDFPAKEWKSFKQLCNKIKPE